MSISFSICETYYTLSIRKHILHIYTDYDNTLGAYKIRRVLDRDYGINISLG